jgi:NAD(P)-dependent dehydrogenase (short-subunit alcohol dehydrogenase family)
MPKLQDKIALITGATGGIGEATAKLFLAEGAKVMLVGRSADKLKATCDRLGGCGSLATRLATSVADASNETAIAAAFANTVSTFGALDIVMANAGDEGIAAPLETQKLEDFERLLRTNVIGVWLAMKYAVEPLKARGAGSIIALSSIAGMVGAAGVAPYVATKHAVYGLVKSAALELGAFGIRVNAIGPGPIDNRMIRSLEEQWSPDDPNAVRAGIVATIPLKRYGTNEEVAQMAAFLASSESSYSTGGIFAIDGGYTAA